MMKDLGHVKAFGRIEHNLKSEGYSVYTADHDGLGTIENNAAQLKRFLEGIMEKEGVDKVNLIAHSKGGLDCRYAIAHYGVGEYIASLTTVNSPHRGCEFAEYLLNELPPDIVKRIEGFYNRMWKRFGDHHPDFIAAVTDLTAGVCIKRDEETELPKGIFCQSRSWQRRF